jgi:hypothetical protein
MGKKLKALMVAGVLAGTFAATVKCAEDKGIYDAKLSQNTASYGSAISQSIKNKFTGLYQTSPQDMVNQVRELSTEINDMVTTYSREIKRGDYDSELNQGIQTLSALDEKLRGYLSSEAKAKNLKEDPSFGNFSSYLDQMAAELEPSDFWTAVDGMQANLDQRYDPQTVKQRGLKMFDSVVDSLNPEGIAYVRGKTFKSSPGTSHQLDINELKEAPREIRKVAIEALVDTQIQSAPDSAAGMVTYVAGKVPESEKLMVFKPLFDSFTADLTLDQKLMVKHYVNKRLENASPGTDSPSVSSTDVEDFKNLFNQ